MIPFLRLFYAVSLCAMFAIPSLVLAEEKVVPITAPDQLTVTQAVEEALANSPRVKAVDAAVNAAEGGLEQADSLPNPELGLEGENVSGTGNYKGIDSADLTYGLSQEIELGGKRSARANAAQHSLTLTRLSAASKRLDIVRDVRTAFAEAVAAQESLRLAEDAVNIAEQEMKSVSRRVAEAASPLIQRSKAEVSLATATFNLEQAKETHLVTRKKLATLLGREGAFEEMLDTSSFFEIEEPKPIELTELLERTPDMMRLRIEEDRAAALLDIEQAESIPDPTVSLGVRELRETSDRAFVMGVSIPIPVFNSNSGNVSKARAEVVETASTQQSERLNLLQRAAESQGALRTAYIKATSYHGTVLPAAERAFQLARQGYGAGKFQYLEVLDAQRTLFDSRSQYMSALRDYHARKSEIERLTTAYTTEGDSHEEE